MRPFVTGLLRTRLVLGSARIRGRGAQSVFHHVLHLLFGESVPQFTRAWFQEVLERVMRRPLSALRSAFSAQQKAITPLLHLDYCKGVPRAASAIVVSSVNCILPTPEQLQLGAIYTRPSSEELVQDLERSRLNVDG